MLVVGLFLRDIIGTQTGVVGGRGNGPCSVIWATSAPRNNKLGLRGVAGVARSRTLCTPDIETKGGRERTSAT